MDKLYCEKQKQKSEASKAKQSTVKHKQESKKKLGTTQRASTSKAIPSPGQPLELRVWLCRPQLQVVRKTVPDPGSLRPEWPQTIPCGVYPWDVSVSLASEIISRSLNANHVLNIFRWEFVYNFEHLTLLKDLDSYCHTWVNRNAQERLRQYHHDWSLAATHKNKIRSWLPDLTGYVWCVW